MSVAATAAGVDAFIAGLKNLGIQAAIEHGVVRFRVKAVFGACAGRMIDTGVSVDELQNWPLAPPHWVHLPSDIVVTPTNAQASPIPGWSMHSRNINGWGNAVHPAQAWVAHVRTVLASAK